MGVEQRIKKPFIVNVNKNAISFSNLQETVCKKCPDRLRCLTGEGRIDSLDIKVRNGYESSAVLKCNLKFPKGKFCKIKIYRGEFIDSQNIEFTFYKMSAYMDDALNTYTTHFINEDPNF